MRPSVVSIWKLGAVSPIRRLMESLLGYGPEILAPLRSHVDTFFAFVACAGVYDPAGGAASGPGVKYAAISLGPKQMRQAHLDLTVNGEALEASFAPYKTLLEVLREDLALTGTKHG